MGVDTTTYVTLLSMQHRDITPEDYDVLQRLDENSQKKTLSQRALAERQMAAAALGLNARYARWLKNFEELCVGVGTFFLVTTRDRENHPGHRIAPSAVYAPVRPVRMRVTPLRRILEKPSATVGIGKQGAVKLGKANRTYFGPDNPSTMRGQGHSLMGMPYPPHDPPRVSMLDNRTISSLSPRELLRIEEAKERARLAAATSYQTCLLALQEMTVEPSRSDSPTFAQEQELDAAQARRRSNAPNSPAPGDREHGGDGGRKDDEKER